MHKIRILTGSVFILLLAVGLEVASQRLLWTDEYFNLTSTLNASYKSLFIGIDQASNSPLFNVIQKLLRDLFSYHPPQEWVEGHWRGTHVFDQVFLRLQSVIFVAAALSALFYYFYRRDSLFVGLYAVAVATTSSIVWVHWTEARPYAVWFSLSLFQILLLLNILEDTSSQNKKKLVYLILVHCLLALSATISAIQIIAAGMVLWMFHRSKALWYLPLVVLPLGICSYYYFNSSHFLFYFVDGPLALISANIPKDRLFIIFISAGILVLRCRFKGWTAQLEMKYLIFLILVLGAFVLELLQLKYGQAPGQRTNLVSSRYLFSLSPVGIVGTVLFSVYLVKAFPSKLWKIAAVLILIGFLFFRAHKTVQQDPVSLVSNFMVF